MVLSTILRDIIMNTLKSNRTLILSNNNFRLKRKRRTLRGTFRLPLYHLRVDKGVTPKFLAIFALPFESKVIVRQYESTVTF